MMTFTKWALASVDGWVCFKIVLYSSFLHLNTFITMSAMNVLKLGLTELRTKISFVWIFVCNSEWTVWWTPGLFLCVRLHFLWESRRGTNEHRRGGTSQNPTEGTIGHGVSGGVSPPLHFCLGHVKYSFTLTHLSPKELFLFHQLSNSNFSNYSLSLFPNIKVKRRCVLKVH